MTTLKLTGVSHLFIVPRLRTSQYLASLVEALPSLSSSSDQLGGENLPDLRSFIVVNNLNSEEGFSRELEHVKSAVDFREILQWSDNARSEPDDKLHRDDVMNIQFTRY